jgi:hypothetical protein
MMRKKDRDITEVFQDTTTVLSNDSNNNLLASRPIIRLLLLHHNNKTLPLPPLLKTNQYTIASLQPIQRTERKDNMP